MMRFVDVLYALPYIFIIIVLTTVFDRGKLYVLFAWQSVRFRLASRWLVSCREGKKNANRSGARSLSKPAQSGSESEHLKQNPRYGTSFPI